MFLPFLKLQDIQLLPFYIPYLFDFKRHILGTFIFVCEVNIVSIYILDRICMPPYGEDWKRSLLASDYELYRRLGELLYIVPSSDKALQLASEQKYRWSFNLVHCHNSFDVRFHRLFTDGKG